MFSHEMRMKMKRWTPFFVDVMHAFSWNEDENEKMNSFLCECNARFLMKWGWKGIDEPLSLWTSCLTNIVHLFAYVYARGRQVQECRYFVPFVQKFLKKEAWSLWRNFCWRKGIVMTLMKKFPLKGGAPKP